MRRPLGLLLALLLTGAAAAAFVRAADATVITWGESLRNVILAGLGAPGTAATRLETIGWCSGRCSSTRTW